MLQTLAPSRLGAGDIAMPKTGAVTTREPWVSLNDAAVYFSVSRRTLERWIEARRIPARRLGRSIRVRLSEVEGSMPRLGAA